MCCYYKGSSSRFAYQRQRSEQIIHNRQRFHWQGCHIEDSRADKGEEGVH